MQEVLYVGQYGKNNLTPVVSQPTVAGEKNSGPNKTPYHQGRNDRAHHIIYM